jgi:hypothetical protein
MEYPYWRTLIIHKVWEDLAKHSWCWEESTNDERADSTGDWTGI